MSYLLLACHTPSGVKTTLNSNYYLDTTQTLLKKNGGLRDLHALRNEFGDGQLRNPIVLETFKHFGVQRNRNYEKKTKKKKQQQPKRGGGNLKI